MRVICAQTEIVWEDKAANHAAVGALLEEVAMPPGSLLVLPEMFATGFSMDVGRVTDSETAADASFLAGLARGRGVYVMAGLVRSAGEGRGRNDCVVYCPEGRERVRYTKLHPFGPGGESRHYEAGRSVETFQWGDFVVAPFICYDLRFPEIFRTAVRRGATLLTVIANWPTPRHDHWTTLLRARAIENQCYVVGVNRCGTDPTLRYSGGSLVVAPDGEPLAAAGDGPAVIQAELDPESQRRYRARLPFLPDMREDFIR